MKSKRAVTLITDYSEEEKISLIIKAFEEYALADIKKIQKNNMPIAAFMLGACFIDQVSGFIYGDVKGRAKKFVSDYLNEVSTIPYDRDSLIGLLRNKLVHNYSLSDWSKPNHIKYALNYDKPEVHLHKEDNAIFINIECFINDLEEAFNLFKKQLTSESRFQKFAVNHFDNFGILVYREIIVKNLKKTPNEE